MKIGLTRLFASALLIAGSGMAFAAEQTPMVTFTVEADGESKAAFKLSSTLSEGQEVRVDWGDGVLSEPVKVVFNDGGWESTTFDGIAKGNVIKVFGDQSTIFEVDASYTVGNLPMVDADFSALTDVKKINIATNAFTSVDLSNCSALEDFRASSNKLTEIKFGDINKVTRLELQNTSATVGENRLASVDLSNLAALSYLSLNFNEIETFDFSPLKKLASVYLMGNNMKEADFSGCPDIYYISLNNNPLETLKLPEVSVKKATVLLLNTYLDFAQLRNALDFVEQKGGRVTAATFVIPVKGDSRVIDLSAYYKQGTDISTFEWKASEGAIPETAYTMENGIFTFTEDYQDAVCTVTNAAFSGRKFVTPPMNIKEAGIELFVSFTVKAGVQENLAFNLSSMLDEGQMVRVDWGDGVLSDPVKVISYNIDPYATKFESVPKGEVIKVYGDPSTIYEVDASWGIGYAKIISADLSKLSDVKKIDFASNAISSIDLTNCKALETFAANSGTVSEIKFGDSPNLWKIKLQNADAKTGENNIKSLDISTLPALKVLYLGYNGTEELDFTKGKALESLYLLGNKFSDVDLSECKNIKLANFNFNPVKSMTLPAEAVNKCTFFLNESYLDFAELQKVIDYADIKKGRVTAATLFIPCEGNTDKFDFSAYFKQGENTSVFAWRDADNLAIPADAYTMENGVFTFSKSYENAVCTVTNSSFSGRTWKTLPVNIKTVTSAIDDITVSGEDAPVEYFDLRGVRVAGDRPGLYIRRQGNKVEKVIVK